MSFRIVRITNLYTEYVQRHYELFPSNVGKPYEQQLDLLLKDFPFVEASYSRNLRELGVEAFDIFTNVAPLQDRWKVENDCVKSGKELIFEQIRALKPDAVWLDDVRLIESKWIEYVRRNVPTVRVVNGQFCAPYNSDNIRNYKALDFLITCTPCLRREFEEKGIETHLIYHGFEPNILDETSIENQMPENRLIFTGSLYTGGGFHKTRIEYLEELLKANLSMKIYGRLDSFPRILSKFLAFYTINFIRSIRAAKLIDIVPLLRQYETYGDTPIKFYSRNLRVNTRPPVYGLDQYKLLSKADICFNIHGEIARDCAGNARLFEATGMGTCLVTDWKHNLSELFELDTEVVTYKSKEECVEKISWLLRHNSEARKIGRAGQARTLRDHTIRNRAELFYEIVKRKLKHT